jgi:hypothetical protein
VFDKLTMRAKPLKARDLILSLSKDEVWIFAFFSILLGRQLLASAGAAPGKDNPPRLRSHARAKAMLALSAKVARLICSLSHRDALS